MSKDVMSRKASTALRTGAGRRGGGVALAVWVLLLIGTLPSAAQVKPLRIGVLALGPRKAPTLQCGPNGPKAAPAAQQAGALPFDVLGLRDELVEKLGYMELPAQSQGKPGQPFVLDVRMGDLQAVQQYAHRFAQDRPDLIFAISTPPVRAAQEATRANPIPIVFPNISDPVRDGFAESLARPGGFLTGVSTQLIQGSGKRVEMFKEMVPRLRRLLVIYQAGFRSAELSVAQMRQEAAARNITLLEKHASNRSDIQAGLSDLSRETVDGIIMAADPVSFANVDVLLETSHLRQVPVLGIVDFLADWGALGAYGPSPVQAGRQAAHYVDKIVKGAKPGNLPIEPSDPVFVVNLKAAACFGIAIPTTILHQANRVIR